MNWHRIVARRAGAIALLALIAPGCSDGTTQPSTIVERKDGVQAKVPEKPNTTPTKSAAKVDPL